MSDIIIWVKVGGGKFIRSKQVLSSNCFAQSKFQIEVLAINELIVWKSLDVIVFGYTRKVWLGYVINHLQSYIRQNPVLEMISLVLYYFLNKWAHVEILIIELPGIILFMKNKFIKNYVIIQNNVLFSLWT